MWSKKPPFGKTISSGDKNEISNTETQAGKTFGIFDKNYSLTPLEKYKFFDYRKMKGVALYMNDSLKCTVIKEVSDEAFQSLWIEIEKSV